MTRRRTGLVAGAAACVLLGSPATAAAHGLVGKTDLAIPRWLFGWAAAIVLVASFVALATLWPKPRIEPLTERERLRYPRVGEVVCGLIGVGLFAGVVYAGLAGKQEATANVLPTWIYVIFWIGLAFASLLFGDVFRAFNPWRALARATAWGLRRAGLDGGPALRYPDRLGRWPAVVGIAGFAWLELVYQNKDAPETLALLSLGYAALQLIGMTLYGIEPWTGRGDAFSVYFGLFARLSPLRWSGGRLLTRPAFTGVTTLDVVPGTVALLCVMIGSTSFDGFSVGTVWVGGAHLFSRLQQAFVDLGANAADASELANSIGLAGMIGVVALLFWVGAAGMRTVDASRSAADLARAFVHSLTPIALAYVVAHYFSLLVYQGQALLPPLGLRGPLLGFLASDPLGQGANLFGTAGTAIDYNVISANVIWYTQVGALLIGHVAGLVLAHDRALTMYGRAEAATRSQYWMLAVMVGFTSLGLWILSATQ